MSKISEEEILRYADFLDELAEEDPDYGLNIFFKIKDDIKKACNDIILRIEEIDRLMPAATRPEKGRLSYEKGLLLEQLAKNILSIRNIFTRDERVECDSNEIDILLQPSTNNEIYSRFLPGYLRKDILIECKNHKEKIDVTLLGKFYSLLRYKTTKFGIMFSYFPLTGDNEWDAAVGLSKKLFLRDNTIIINITIDDIKNMLQSNDLNLITVIKEKVEHIKFHTEVRNSISTHPAEKKMKKPAIKIKKIKR